MTSPLNTAASNTIPFSTGYTCSKCQGWVPSGYWHFCPNSGHQEVTSWVTVPPSPTIEEIRKALREEFERLKNDLINSVHVRGETLPRGERLEQLKKEYEDLLSKS